MEWAELMSPLLVIGPNVSKEHNVKEDAIDGNNPTDEVVDNSPEA